MKVEIIKCLKDNYSYVIIDEKYNHACVVDPSEADLYALKTLSLLRTNSKSIQTLLETIEQKLLNKGFSKDKQRLSSHPYFEDRISLIKNFEDNKENNISALVSSKKLFLFFLIISFKFFNDIFRFPFLAILIDSA